MVASWDKQHLSRLLTQVATSKSNAVNFDANKWSGLIPVTAGDLGSRNLHEIQESIITEIAVRRKTLQARFDIFATVPPPRSPSVTSCSTASEGPSPIDDKRAEEIERHGSPQSFVTERKSRAKVVKMAFDIKDDNIRNDDKNAEKDGDHDSVVASPISFAKEDPPKPMGPTHNDCLCDGCKTNENIIGIRWKCLRCADYDLCDKCHSTGAHEHSEFLKIEHPDDYKIWEFVVSLSNNLLTLCSFDIPVFLGNDRKRG